MMFLAVQQSLYILCVMQDPQDSVGGLQRQRDWAECGPDLPLQLPREGG